MGPIHDAAKLADVAALRRVLESGVSPDATEKATDRTALHILCQNTPGADCDRVACVKILREAGANLEATFHSSRALHCAAFYGNLSLLSLLVEAGVNVNATKINGKTALHSALEGNNRRITECVELLLKAGAAVNVVSTFGLKPFDLALNRGYRRTYPLLLRAGAEFRYYTPNQNPYTLRVQGAGGFKKYEQAHLARITAILAPTPLLPPELVRKILEFWLHAGYY